MGASTMFSTRSLFSILTFVGLLFQASAQNLSSGSSADEFSIRTGVNVSHWLSQSEKRGDERRSYITKLDFDSIASFGFDHVRIPVDEVQLWDSLGNKEKEAFELLHNAIDWAIAARLRVIVDLHIIRSHYFNATSNRLWTVEAEQEKLVDMWRQLSHELIRYPNSTVAYEILNEAVAENPEDWNKLLKKVISDIRFREPNRKIVIGSNRWQSASTFPDLKIPPGERNVILSFHFYTPMALTHHLAPWMAQAAYAGPVKYPGQIVDTMYYNDLPKAAVEFMRSGANGYFTRDILEEKMAPAIKFAKGHNLPLYCGEFGVYPTIADSVKLAWYKDVCDILNKNKIAYCHWCYRGDFPVVDQHRMPNRSLVSILTGH
jgi:endoglucanase